MKSLARIVSLVLIATGSLLLLFGVTAMIFKFDLDFAQGFFVVTGMLLSPFIILAGVIFDLFSNSKKLQQNSPPLSKSNKIGIWTIILVPILMFVIIRIMVFLKYQ